MVSGQQHAPAVLYPPGKEPVHIFQEAGWAPGPVWTGAGKLVPTGIRPRTVQPIAQSLNRLSYRAHYILYYGKQMHNYLTNYNT